MMHRRFAAIGVVVILALQACGGESSSDPTVAADRDGSTVPSTPPTSISSSKVRSSFNKIAHFTEAVVVGSVVDVGDTRWNSTDGREWTNDSHEGIRPIAYYDVTVAVEEVPFDAGTIEAGNEPGVRPGDKLVIRVVGEPPAQDDTSPRVRDDGEWYGRFVEGSTMVLMLGQEWEFPYQDGTTEEVIQTWAGYLGTWVVEERRGERFARNLEDAWSAPLDRLLERFAEERAAGMDNNRDTMTSIVPSEERRP